MYRRTL